MRPRSQRGISLLELLIVVAIILVLSAIATINLMSARRAAREAAATSAVRNVTTAQMAYAYAWGGFADELRKLGPPARGAASADAADLLDASIACPTGPCRRQGYELRISGASGLPVTRYFITAGPVQNQEARSFCSSESAVLYSVQAPDPMDCIAEMLHQTGQCVGSDPRCGSQ